MKLGLLADIHESYYVLQAALARFRDQNVDRVVLLGDVMEAGSHLDQTCRLLVEADVVGVWGNHDFALCCDPHTKAEEEGSAAVMGLMSRLRPRLEIDGCHFTHVEPWLDPEDAADLWYLGGPPMTLEQVARSFRAVPNRILFTGHYHRWLIATPERIHDWHGQAPFQLDPVERHLIVVAAACDGWYATFDTVTLELVPHQV